MQKTCTYNIPYITDSIQSSFTFIECPETRDFPVVTTRRDTTQFRYQNNARCVCYYRTSRATGKTVCPRENIRSRTRPTKIRKCNRVCQPWFNRDPTTSKKGSCRGI